MLLLLLSVGVGIATIKWLESSGRFDLGEIFIFIILGLIISAICASILKRKSKKIVVKRKKLENEQPKLEEDEHLFIFDVLGILNKLAFYFTILYFLSAGMCMLGVVVLYGYIESFIIIGIVATIVVIDIVLFFVCYSATKSVTDSIILMQYIEASMLKIIYVLSIFLALILVWYSIAFIFLCLFIIGFGSKLGG